MSTRKINVAFVNQQELWHVCYSYSMVKAIWESLKVVNDADNFLGFVSQNFLATPWTGAPVSAQLGSPPQLRARRDQIFQQDCVPWLNALNYLSPRVVASGIHQFEVAKADMLIDIRARFDRVQTANERIRKNLDTSKKAMIILERAGACTVIAFGAAAVLVGVAASATAAAGVATAAEAGVVPVLGQAATALTAAGTAHSAGMLAMVFGLAHGAVKSWRELGSDESHAWAWSAGKTIWDQTKAHAFEEYGKLPEMALHAGELERMGVIVDRLLLSGSQSIVRSPKFLDATRNYIASSGKITEHVLKHGGVCAAGTVVCAGSEIWDNIKEGMEDWER